MPGFVEIIPLSSGPVPMITNPSKASQWELRRYDPTGHDGGGFRYTRHVAEKSFAIQECLDLVRRHDAEIRLVCLSMISEPTNLQGLLRDLSRSEEPDLRLFGVLLKSEIESHENA